MSAFETAQKFFQACEAPQGWDGCKSYVADGAGFSCQAGALAGVTTLRDYCEWMKGLAAGPLPDCTYTLHAKSWDPDTNTATFVATFHATHTGEGGPVPPTNKSFDTDYVYAIRMNGDGKVASMTKVWNDAHALAQLGWT
ncbi:MAG: ester cyclase [Alphaproteobacteria bacterium]|nr:ester cyclase [Alphaproteobacteria bacterium]MCB9928396.1 ester cyclase [Alphaproteobacteria bacterium]